MQNKDEIWHLFRVSRMGDNIQDVIETEDCKVLRLEDSSGDGTMTVYRVFDGVFLMFNDFHMKYCLSGFSCPINLLCIDHCREGCMELVSVEGIRSYLEAGDLQVDRRTHHKGDTSFPLAHYHGITIGFEIDTAQESLGQAMPIIPIDLSALYEKFAQDGVPFVLRKDPTVEHIFEELYHVPSKIRMDYYRIKVMELLLYLNALNPSVNADKPLMFYSAQTEKVKSIHDFITSDLTRSYTAEELAERFRISLNTLKSTFKGIYRSPLYAYMRQYRMNYAASALIKHPNMKIIEVAALVGYDNPSKFSAAFRETMGMSPVQYRKTIQQRSE